MYMMAPIILEKGLTRHAAVLGVLATPVQFWLGKPFYLRAWRGLVHCNFGMDVLVCLGTTASYSYSLLAIFLMCMNPDFHGHHFFETSAMLLTFVVLGKLMECFAKGKTTTALVKLMGLQPKTAILLEKDTRFEKEMPGVPGLPQRVIDVKLVQVGDVVKVTPGMKVPVDGDIIFGRGALDESMITGEAIPIAKTVGDAVFGGTVNETGVLHVRATRVGRDTALAQIVTLVEEAQTSKAPIQQYADKIAGIFAPIVIGLSVTTFFVWLAVTESGAFVVPAEQATDPAVFSLLFSIAVMVVACPCALGLATPTAVMVGTGVGAQLGVLIKGGAALELAQGIEVVVFDKTGTLTEGKPTVSDYLVFDDSEGEGGGWGRGGAGR
jgi:Cu+-exporting ATPase